MITLFPFAPYRERTTLANLLRFVASRRRRPVLASPSESCRVELSALVDNIQIITAYSPLALRLCASFAQHYADSIRRRLIAQAMQDATCDGQP